MATMCSESSSEGKHRSLAIIRSLRARIGKRAGRKVKSGPLGVLRILRHKTVAVRPRGMLSPAR